MENDLTNNDFDNIFNELIKVINPFDDFSIKEISEKIIQLRILF
jgi:hypothetical protein